MITVETNKKYVDFLDKSFNIKDRSYIPCRKSSDRPLYTNVDLNNQWTVIKNCHKALTKDSYKYIATKKDHGKGFCKTRNETVKVYNEALKEIGYNHNLSFDKDYKDGSTEQDFKRNKEKEKKTNNIVQPFCQKKKEKCNNGKNFLLLVDKYCPKTAPNSKQ